MTTQFRGITERQGVLLQGDAGWGEWSPFLDYHGAEIVPWQGAALEAADEGWPEPVRDSVEVNATVPVVSPEAAQELVRRQGCGTAKVKVADPRSSLDDDLERLVAVREVLGPGGRLRIDANGLWSVDEALVAIGRLRHLDLEYVEQPCAAVEDLARLRLELARRGWNVLVAADESIRRSGDPERVRDLEAADVAVLKVQPLGGVRRCLRLAEDLGMPVVVSSALESSVGLAAGVALAAALPELPHACGLNTATLLTRDVTSVPLVAEGGRLTVRPVVPDLVAEVAADGATEEFWAERWRRTAELADHLG